MQNLLKEIYSALPTSNMEQRMAIAKVWGWGRSMEKAFRGGAASERYNCLQHFGLGSRDRKNCSSQIFFVRGPPGTGKTTFISWLIYLALKGHSDPQIEDSDCMPTTCERVLVLTHTNAAIDDIMEKVIKTKKFKKGRDGVEPLVRVGIRGESDVARGLTAREIVRARTVGTSRQGGPSRITNRRRLEADVVTNADVVFTTLGSMGRSEFLRSRKPYNVIVVEEAAKISHGDLLNALTLAIGMKDTLDAGRPVLIALVGDELQLPPFLGYDANLNVSRFQSDSLFAHYVSKFRSCGVEPDYNKPVTLLKQHRAHSAIAEVINRFAYEGKIRNGVRSPQRPWITNNLGPLISTALSFNVRPLSVVSYNGVARPDTKDSTRGGCRNETEAAVAV